MIYQNFAMLALALAVAAPVRAQVSTAYRYDVLGRIISSSVAGPSSNNKTTMIGYDPAGNRVTYRIGNGSTGFRSSPAFAARISTAPVQHDDNVKSGEPR